MTFSCAKSQQRFYPVHQAFLFFHILHGHPPSPPTAVIPALSGTLNAHLTHFPKDLQSYCCECSSTIRNGARR